MNWLKRLLVVLLLLLSSAYVLLFCLRNSTFVDIDLFFLKLTHVPIELGLVGSFILGGLFGILASFSLLYKMRKKYRKALLQAKQTTQIQK